MSSRKPDQSSGVGWSGESAVHRIVALGTWAWMSRTCADSQAVTQSCVAANPVDVSALAIPAPKVKPLF
ncbi:MAG: hypothetical protein JRH10_18865 [Deltaproteobacteria bacterium]|nr:hypothetical protein [Deltaproteobacteria bacterium]